MHLWIRLNQIITLNGKSTLTLILGDSYTEAGAAAIDEKDGNVEVRASGIVDTSKVGTYSIVYTASDKAGNSSTVTRTVNVVLPPDTTVPVITLLGANPVEIVQGSAYQDAGAMAQDDRDGNITQNIIVHSNVDTTIAGKYRVQYDVNDAAGNKASTVTRTVNVVLPADTTAPAITLNGESNMTLTVGDVYVELGATAVDDRDGNVSVEVNAVVDTNTTGIYTVVYTAIDTASNVAKAYRTVNVISDVNNTQIAELQDLLDDPSIPYATDADFNKTEYAKHHLADDEAKKLERAHMLVATAKDPDPEWFYTQVDKSVIVTDAGTEHTIHLKKMRKDGTVYAPVDNDKLRLVVRIQRSKDNFEYITNANIDQYAYWDGAGVLKIHVPDDLDKGRMMVGIRPNFDDVATSAIAERWSTVIVAEVWKVKQGVINVDEANVLFPIDNNARKGLSAESQFTLSEIAQKVQTELTTNSTLLLPMVVKNMSLVKDDKVSYMFQGKPYAGQVMFVEHRGEQDFVLLAPKLFDVYNIMNADDGFMIKEGLYPENVIIREGGRQPSDANESDPVIFKAKSMKTSRAGDVVGLYKKICIQSDAFLTFSTKISLDPPDVGVDLRIFGAGKDIHCVYTARTRGIKLNPAYFAALGPVAIAMAALGTDGELKGLGNISLKAQGALGGFGYDIGYSLQKGGRMKLNRPDVGGLGDRDLAAAPVTATAELASGIGVRFELNAVSADSALSMVMSWLGVDVGNIGVNANALVKGTAVMNAKNASEVLISGSSELAVKYGISASIAPSLEMQTWLKYFGVVTLKVSQNIDLIEPFKAKADFYFGSVKDNGQGNASLTGLLPSSYAMHILTPNNYEGVLSIEDSASTVWNDNSEDITYDLAECAKDPDYKIVSPAIACAGWMCGVVTKEVALCKGKLSISEVVASARVGQLASTGASVINKAGDIDVTVSGSPLVPQTTSLHMPADSAEYVVFEKMCTSKGVIRGTSHVTAQGTNLSAQAPNTLLCHDDDTHGDPHIVTGDKLGYDYYASGDYILSRIKDITGYEIQARFLPGYKTSWPQAVALQVGNDVVEVQGVKRDGHGNGSGVPINALAIWVNGKKGILGIDNRYSYFYDEDSISKRIAKLPSGGIIAVTHTDSSNVLSFASNLTIIWPKGSQAQNYGVILSVAKNNDPFVHIQIARPDDFAGQERGLMGNNDGDPTNDFIRRNGEVLGVDHNISFTELYALFGTDWLVRPYESLFRNPEAIKPEFPTDVVTLTPEQRALGEQACAGLIGFYREACIIDVGLTGNAELVKEYYANTQDLNYLSEQIATPDVDQALYTMNVADKAYESDSAYYLHYKQDINISHLAGEGGFMLLVRPPRGATALLGTGDMSYTGEGNYFSNIEVDCTELNAQTNSEFFLSTGAVQLWLQDPLSGTATKMLSEVALPCTDASKRAGYSLKRGKRTVLADSNDTNLHYTQPLNILHTNSYAGAYMLEVIAPVGAVVKLNDSTTELNITGSEERNDTLELDCSMAESNASNGSVKLWEKDMLSGSKAYNYASYTLSCRKSKVLITGQTTSYVDFDDGDYQVGETRSYSRDDAKEVVMDNATGLEWQDNVEAKIITKNWADAQIYCSNLSLDGGGWRLPTRAELVSLSDYGRTSPAINPTFVNAVPYYYWSSTSYAGYSGNAWYVYFGYGGQSYDYKYDSSYVRCVRAGQ